MSARQKDLYLTAINKSDRKTRKTLNKSLSSNKKDLSKLLPFFSGLRALANTNQGIEQDISLIEDPKINKAFNLLNKAMEKDPNFKGIVYSNYLDNGIHSYAKHLDEHNIPYGEFSGDMGKKVRDNLVREYNKNKLKVLLLSSAGGEGLDLKNTKLVQLLEPHFNNEKLDQVIGRAIRYKSHASLPPEERKVLIQEFLSDTIKDKNGKNIKSVDEYLYDMAKGKKDLNKQVEDLMKDNMKPSFLNKLRSLV